MTNKQIELLDKFQQDMLCSPLDRVVVGSKYKNGNDVLTAHDLSSDLWNDLLMINDSQDLWQQVDRYLQKF